jgi:DNA-binding response OmpR family regulator
MPQDYRIILVDDDDDILWINQKYLTKEGYSVDTSNDPEKALDMILSHDYDLAILDYMMPKMRGDELAKKIISTCRHTHIIYLTGYSEFSSYMEYTGDTRNTVLLKPLSKDELLHAVELKLARAKSILYANT